MAQSAACILYLCTVQFPPLASALVLWLALTIRLQPNEAVTTPGHSLRELGNFLCSFLGSSEPPHRKCMLLRNHCGKEEVLRLHEERGPVCSASQLSPAPTCFALPCECTHAKVY